MDFWLKTGTLKRTTESPSTSASNVNDTTLLDEVQEVPITKKIKISEGIKTRKYDENYLQFGFTWVGDANEPNGLCVVCEKVICNSSLNPAKLKRHLETNHANLCNKSVEYFKRKNDELKKKTKTFCKYVLSDNAKSLEASFRISYRIAREGEAYTIAEKLIKPCIKDVISCKFGETYLEEVNSIPLSDTTIARRIEEMALFCENDLINRLKTSNHPFALQLDETTDVAGLAVLIVLVRYVFNSSVQEDMLFCKPLVGRTTGEEIFKLINLYMEKHKISWNLCAHICTDGAKSLLGREKGAISRIIQLAPHIKHSHCCLHRHQLAVRRISQKLKDTLEETVQIINFIKKQLNSRLFALLCEELSSTHKTLLLHAEVRWLSRGKILTRFVELKDEVRLFLNEHNHKYAAKLNCEIWLQTVCYLADIFSVLNEYNKSLQGININIIKMHDKINSLLLKLDLWESYVKSNNVQCFQMLNSFLIENELVINNDVRQLIEEHIIQLKRTIRIYFPETTESYEWIKDPFQYYNKSGNLMLKEREPLIDISTDSVLKCAFERKGLLEFWIKLYAEYPEISTRAIRILLPFVSTYLCEHSFSIYVATKTKYRNRLDAENEMRLQITNILPDFNILCKGKQAHPSH
ncbi:zinc finger BED domain-containing protein 5-like [Onthophagus taurus]|uniref:zinc finger BED domain-containing protein 5-like n=1 Tax=Onthophagus taurus TaxID=166361 RepID=UPI0039BE6EC6